MRQDATKMPLGFLLRLLARITFMGAAGALGRGQVPPAWRTPGQQVPGGAQAPRQGGSMPIPEGGLAGALSRAMARRMGPAVDVGRILVHLLSLLVFLAATVTLGTAGTTLTTLGPRWVGILILVVALLPALVTVGEIRVTIRLRDEWRRRRRAERLRAAAASLPPPANQR